MATETLTPSPATTTSPPRPPRSSRGWAILAALIAVAAFVSGAWLAPKLQGNSNGKAAAQDPQKKGEKLSYDPKTTVLLPEGKFKAADIKLAPARREALATEVGVPGQITLNTDRRVDIRPRVFGVVRSVQATLGQKLKAGEVLVTLDSPDIGTARLDLRKRQRELATARVEWDWRREVAANVEALIPLLRKDTPARQIEELFRGKPLGNFRSDLMGNYAEFEIAEHESEKQADLGKQGLVGEHPVFLSKHKLESMRARFEASLEQVRFDAAQQARVADQQVRAAEASVIDAAQRLRILGVSEDMVKALAPGAVPATTPKEYEDVTAYPIVAPFDGTITARTVVPSQRAEPIDSLFVLADLSTVRVTADVPESRIGLLPRIGTPRVRITAEALKGKTFDASVIYVGKEVDPTTRSVALLAEMPNVDELFFPGMFVQINFDTPQKVDAVTVPAGAVIEIDGKAGVFRAGKEDRMYTFNPVVAGRTAEGRRVIESGLKEGDEVVVNGAFVLKSELVLQNEKEED
jgi:cobalt-zinc-cadmium efflux system membrane fusion protein